MHKPIYGTPSSIFAPTSAGLHERIAAGDISLVDNIPHFVDTFFPAQKQLTARTLDTLSTEEQTIYTYLQLSGSATLDELLGHTPFQQSEILPLLTMLEIGQYIYQPFPGNYALAR